MRDSCPHVLSGTPSRLLTLLDQNALSLDQVSHLVIYDCDTYMHTMAPCLLPIFFELPLEKEVMLFSNRGTRRLTFDTRGRATEDTVAFNRAHPDL